MSAERTPRAVSQAQQRIGEDLASWRKLRRLTVEQVADRADIGKSTLGRLENGGGANLETVLRVARALGVLDQIAASLDPYATEVGQLRAEEALPRRVRHRKAP